MNDGIIWWIIMGLVAGWLSGKITRGHGFGLLADLFLGLIGGVIGGYVFTLLGIHAFGLIGSLAAATVGATILVALARLFTPRCG